MIVVAALAVVAARPGSRHRASLLAVATGTCCGLGAVLTKQVTAVWSAGGVGAVLTRWPVWALAAAGTAALLLGQSAYQAGPLTARCRRSRSPIRWLPAWWA